MFQDRSANRYLPAKAFRNLSISGSTYVEVYCFSCNLDPLLDLNPSSVVLFQRTVVFRIHFLHHSSNHGKGISEFITHKYFTNSLK